MHGHFYCFAGVSSYLTFKLSAWKQCCTISFELKMLDITLNPFWKLLQSYVCMYARKLHIRRNNNKVDSVATGCIVIAHLLP